MIRRWLGECTTFMFVGDREAGENLVVLYSIVSTGEAHGVNPTRTSPTCWSACSPIPKLVSTSSDRIAESR
jgi:hypothetical protein